MYFTVPSRSWTRPWSGNTAEVEEDTAASALLLFLDGGAGHLGEALLEPTLTTLGNFLARSNSQASSWGTLCALRLPVQGHGLQLGDVRQRGRQRLCGRHRHLLGTPSQGVWSTARLDFSVPGGVTKLHFGAFGGSIPGLVQQSAGTLDLYSTQIRALAFEGESVSVTDLLADSLALTGLATLDGLTAQGNVGCDQLLCNDVNCTDVFTTGVDASGAVSCAALTATGTVAGPRCRPQGPCQAAR